MIHKSQELLQEKGLLSADEVVVDDDSSEVGQDDEETHETKNQKEMLHARS